MNYRTKLIKLFTFIGGLYFFLKFLLPKKFVIPWGHEGVPVEFGKYHEQISLGITAMFVMWVGLGIGNLIFRNMSTIAYRRQGAINSFILLVGLGAMLILSGLQWEQSLTSSKKSERFFMLKDFAERIKSDAMGETTIVVPEGNKIPSPLERTVALQGAVAAEVEATRAEVERFSREPSSAVPSTLDELRIILENVNQGARNLSLTTTADGKLDFSGHSVLAKSLAEAGAKRSEVLTFAAKNTHTQKAYDLLFSGIFVSLGSAMFSLLGFYIASAAYRAFRIRSYESGLMMGAALLVILGQIPFMLFGENSFGLWLHVQLPAVRLWLLTVPNSAAFRAIEIGAAIAGLVMAFRMWLSIESTSFGSNPNKRTPE